MAKKLLPKTNYGFSVTQEMNIEKKVDIYKFISLVIVFNKK